MIVWESYEGYEQKMYQIHRNTDGDYSLVWWSLFGSDEGQYPLTIEEAMEIMFPSLFIEGEGVE